MSIIKKIRRTSFSFWRMPFKHKLMFFVNYFLCGIARASINILPLPYLSPYFGTFCKTTTISQLVTKEQARRASQIGKSVRLAAKFTPWDSSCLTQAMVAKFWCRLFKIPYALYIGFAKCAESNSGFKAHAWITAGPIAITGGYSFSEFCVVSSYFSIYACPMDSKAGYCREEGSRTLFRSKDGHAGGHVHVHEFDSGKVEHCINLEG